MPDFRSTPGRRYPLATIVTIAVAAKLAGYRGATAIGEFSQGLTQHQLRALRAFYSPRLKRFTAPSTTAFVKVLTPLGPRRARPRGAHLGRTAGLAHRPRRHRREVHPWRRPVQPGRQAPARRRRRAPLRNRLGQEAVQNKSNEIPAVRTLLTGARPRRARRDPRRVAHLPPPPPGAWSSSAARTT